LPIFYGFAKLNTNKKNWHYLSAIAISLQEIHKWTREVCAWANQNLPINLTFSNSTIATINSKDVTFPIFISI
jgi:hypothetical protein